MQTKTGILIRTLRGQLGLTQKALGDAVGVSDKAISKWERGLGCPDVSLLVPLAKVLGVEVDNLLSGELSANRTDGGNMKRISFYRCPTCGSIFTGSGKAQLSCCGRPLSPLVPQEPDGAHALCAEMLEGELYLTFDHPMSKEHHLCFAAGAALDRVTLVRLYPEGGAELRIPYPRGGGTVFWCCTEHGLFAQKFGRFGR